MGDEAAGLPVLYGTFSATWAGLFSLVMFHCGWSDAKPGTNLWQAWKEYRKERTQSVVDYKKKKLDKQLENQNTKSKTNNDNNSTNNSTPQIMSGVASNSENNEKNGEFFHVSSEPDTPIETSDVEIDIAK